MFSENIHNLLANEAKPPRIMYIWQIYRPWAERSKTELQSSFYCSSSRRLSRFVQKAWTRLTSLQIFTTYLCLFVWRVCVLLVFCISQSWNFAGRSTVRYIRERWGYFFGMPVINFKCFADTHDGLWMYERLLLVLCIRQIYALMLNKAR